MIWILLGFEHYLMGIMHKLQNAAKYFVRICIHLNLSGATFSHLRQLTLPNTSIVKRRLKKTSWAANTESVMPMTCPGPVTLYNSQTPTCHRSALWISHSTRLFVSSLKSFSVWRAPASCCMMWWNACYQFFSSQSRAVPTCEYRWEGLSAVSVFHCLTDSEFQRNLS